MGMWFMAEVNYRVTSRELSKNCSASIYSTEKKIQKKIKVDSHIVPYKNSILGPE